MNDEVCDKVGKSAAPRRLAACGLFLFAVACTALAQAPVPDPQVLFDAAVRSLQLGASERAEQEFAEFVNAFPNSPRFAEAILYQGQAAVRQQKYPVAIALLTTNAARAGNLADRYRFWVGEAHFRSSNYVAAAEIFSKMIVDFPDSQRLLSAAHGEAWARFRMREFEKTIDLLQTPEGAFQRAAYERRTDTLAIRGQLLLVEAHLELGDDVAAARAVARLADRSLTPEMQWRRDYTLCRIEVLRKNYRAALSLVTNLHTLSASTDQAPLKAAEAIAVHGSILEQAGDADGAIQIYTNNLTAAAPSDYRRAAFLRIIELTLGQNRLTEAAQQLEQFFAQYPRDAGSDLARLTLGELRLKQYSTAVEISRTNSNYVAPTNHLHDALSHFEYLRTAFPESPLLGHAHLNRGWCYWELGNMSESQAAFRLAIEKLRGAEHLAVARFKLADTQFRQRDYSGAVDNYRWAMREVAGMPALKESLSAQALYQVLRAMLEMGRLKEAEETMTRLLEDYPDQLYGDRGLLLLGHGLVRAAKPADARALFLKFAEKRKDSPLRPQVEFAIARSYAEEKEWQQAAQQYSSWLERYRTNALRPQVEFDRAWVYYMAGQDTNALPLFTNFVARYPGTPLGVKAQFWVADYYLRTGNYTNAELSYGNTNVANLYEARMMAGRAAFARQAYKNAQDYFTGLVNDENCPPDLAAEAFFALGDTFLLGEGDAANAIKKFDQAKEAYRQITIRYPQSRLAPLAWGQMGNCYFQLATADPKHYADALDAYFRVLAPTNAAGLAARSQAEFGIAQVYERQAKGPPERGELLKSALDYYLNIFNGKNLKAAEAADPVWARQSGFAAARLAEEQKNWSLALNIYLGLRELAPASRDSLDRKIARLREQIGGERANR